MNEQANHHNQIVLFGGLSITGKTGPLTLRGHKARSLLALLALRPGTSYTREIISDLLWPDFSADRARRNLSDVLYRLRQQLGATWFLTEGEQISLNPDADIWVDVWAFEQWAQEDDPIAWEKAVALYKGDLLPEIYDDWVLERRVSLREVYLNTLYRLGQTAEHHNDQQKAYHYYKRLVATDAIREDASRGLMRSLASMGRITEALSTYTQLEERLADELGVTPTEQTQQLAARLQQDVAVQQQNRLARPPFAGRVEERALLLSRLDQALTGQGGIVTLLGEVGIGKSRLLDELAQAADWRGWQVAWGRGQEFALLPPYTPLTQTLTSALPRPRLQQLAQLIRPLSLAITAQFVPHIADTLALPDVSHVPHPHQQLPLAISHVLDGLQQIAPHLLILEDIHWADTAVWSLLSELRPALHEMSILLVISGRLDELRQQPAAWESVQAWDQAGETTVYLRGLDLSTLHQLALVTYHMNLSEAELTNLLQMSGGNPLLALNLLETGDLHDNPTQPATFQQMTQQRLKNVSDVAEMALQAAAVIGYQFDYRLWEMVISHMPAAELPQLAGELEQGRFLLLDANGYRFAHDTLRAGIYNQIPEARRTQLHHDTLTALKQSNPDDTSALLHHAEQANQVADIAWYAMLAGKQALSGYSYETAVARFAQALAVLPNEAWSERYTAVRGQLEALHILVNREAQQESLARLLSLAKQSGDPRYLAEAGWHQAEFYWQIGEMALAQETAVKALEQAQKTADLRLQAALLRTAGRLARDRGEYGQAQACFQEGLALYRRLEDKSGQASILQMLGIVSQRLDDYQQAIQYYQQAVQLTHETEDPFFEMRILSNLAIVYWVSDDYVQATATFKQALQLSQELGARRVEAACLGNLGSVSGIVGDYEASLDYLNQALAHERLTNNLQGVSGVLNNLGKTCRNLGQFEQSLVYFDEALALNQQMKRRRGEGFSQHGRGTTLLELGRYAEARQALEKAIAIRQELGELRYAVATQTDLALAYLAEGNPDRAQQTLDDIFTHFDPQNESSESRKEVHYAAYELYQAKGDTRTAVHHLRQAEKAMMALARPLTSADRERFLQRVPLNKKVQAALATLTREVDVRLVRDDVPLGRKLTEADYVTIRWTIYAPEDDDISQTAVRRRHILQRLLHEAATQGAAPTDDDLAQALDVSRRTVLRDMKALTDSGVTLPTRRRAS